MSTDQKSETPTEGVSQGKQKEKGDCEEKECKNRSIPARKWCTSCSIKNKFTHDRCLEVYCFDQNSGSWIFCDQLSVKGHFYCKHHLSQKGLSETKKD